METFFNTKKGLPLYLYRLVDQFLTLDRAMIHIVNEITRQHRMYIKACITPINDVDFENLLEESMSSNFLAEKAENLLIKFLRFIIEKV